MPFLADPAEVAAIRGVFERADYTDRGLVDTLGQITLPSHAGRSMPHFLQLTSRGRPLDTLIRLFLLGIPVESEAARRALDPVPVAAWERAGLLETGAGGAAARVKFMTFRGVLVAVDQVERPEIAARSDQVVGLTASTVSAAEFAVRRPSRATLDLGTGSGILAFLAARHSGRVVGTDCSARALEFARFNCALNGISNVEFRGGNSFEPVRGERFDLVISNPPFAVTPSTRFLYRDGGLEGDGFCRRLLREAPAFLEEGGFCQITCDWAHVAGQDWKQRLAAWFDGTGCDAWVLRVDTHDPAAYANMWIRDTEVDDPLECRKVYEEWVSWYARQRIEAISSGLIAIRRRAGSNWVRFDDVTEDCGGPIGDAVALGFELRDFVASAGAGDGLLEARLRVAPGVKLEQHCQWTESGWQIQSAQVRQTAGLRFAGNIDRHAITLMGLCDGRQPLRELIARFAARVGADPAKITADCLKLVRPLVEAGFLLPGDLPAEEKTGSPPRSGETQLG